MDQPRPFSRLLGNGLGFLHFTPIPPLYKVEGNYPKGENQVTLKKEQLGASGVLYYTLETAEYKATKKMVILE